ncbi:MAG: glutamine--fructose-6-phosphate transaminase (isomerizing), partial [Oscillospiraceae bacterium]|nr:glutamine--fructose-6-phosphate transaminase (isomerizing) [Oscillospiraceae bacterium]
KGRLEVLKGLTDEGRNMDGTIGIGHTRWATHGEPNDVNSHPHLSQDNKIAVVHNGIIENYVEIKEFLLSKGVCFQSETDTEVVAQLLAFYYRQDGDLMMSVYRVLHRIEGAYALGILCADTPGSFIAARKDAPLLLGYGKGCNFIASDVTAIIKHTREVSFMEDGEVALVTADSITVFDALGRKIDKEHSFVEWDISAAEKGGYAHFMFKEIMEQPDAVRKTVAPRIKEGRIVFDELKLDEAYIRGMKKIFIVACGSSYHVGMVGKYNLERLIRIPVDVMLASEFRYADPLVDEGTLVIVISQSGETLDSMAALRKARDLGARILSIVNVVGSSIARESDHVLYTWAGPEIAVATTKAYSTQLVLLDMLGIWFADICGRISSGEYSALLEELRKLPEKMEMILKNTEDIKYFASRYFNHDSVFYIGRNLDYALGLESSLKLKEISYVHSEAYASGELKHGTISLIENGTLVIALSTFLPLFDKELSNIIEVKSRGADVIALTTCDMAEELKKTVQNVICIPRTSLIFQPSLGIIPMQLFAYYVALQRGCDIDKPRNLAKSVTVE